MKKHKYKHKCKISALFIFIFIFALNAVSAVSLTDLNYFCMSPFSVFQGAVYSENPSCVSPFYEGRLTEAFLQDGLNAVNFYRLFAGLPADIEIDAALSEEAQHGALLLDALNTLTHSPLKPAGMGDEFYSEGLLAVRSGNLCYGVKSLSGSVMMYMSDSDEGNIDRLGHRRWLLNPGLKKTGFGYSDGYSVMRVFDQSRTDRIDYDFIAWPNKGYFPTQLFKGSDAWSVSLNPDKYDNKRISEISVKLIGLSSGKVWDFDNNHKDKSGRYFNVDTNGYGIPFCIIFRPEGLSVYNEDEQYSIEISGLYDKAGNRVQVKYTVEFVDVVNTMQFLIGSPYMNVNGTEREIDPGRGTKPVIINDRTLLPIRTVVETIGGEVEWDENERSVVVRLDNKEIKLWVGSRRINVDGVQQQTDVEPQIINNRTMVPLRVVIENLDCEVIWDGYLKQIMVFYE